MKPKRILAVNHVRSLLMDGVADLISAHENDEFELLSTPANNLDDLILEVKQLKPNIIIMEEVSSFINPAELITTALTNGNIRLIVLNSRYSKMDIYDKNELMVYNFDHFIEALNYGTH